MNKFKVGDRVICLQEQDKNKKIINQIGTVIQLNGTTNVRIEFDNNINGHSGNGNAKGKHGHVWNVEVGKIDFANLSPILEKFSKLF